MQFKTRIVRDLAWVISSPPLVSGEFQQTHWWTHEECLAELTDCVPALVELDKNPRRLQQHLDQMNSGRLGIYFEALIAFWLKISPNFALLEQNVQIIENGITHGEIDFIIEDLRTNGKIHLEVAVKFYLGTAPLNNPYRWYGTNTQDQLGKKVDHLKKHQTQLSNQHQSHFQHEIDARHCILKGRLFYPHQATPSGPYLICKKHLQGIWLDADAYSPADCHYIKIAKKYWFAELDQHDCENMEKLSDFPDLKFPQCYAVVEKNNAGKWVEKQRVFKLPRDFHFPEFT